MRKLLGKNDIEDALKRLETLNVEEARMAIAETLNVTHKVNDKMMIFVNSKKFSFLFPSTHLGVLKMHFARLHREPVTRETSEVALSSESLDESCYCTQDPP